MFTICYTNYYSMRRSKLSHAKYEGHAEHNNQVQKLSNSMGVSLRRVDSERLGSNKHALGADSHEKESRKL